MRSFMILQNDRKPMRIKGQRLVPATIITPHEPGACWTTTTPVIYVGAFSQVTVTVLAGGFPAKAAAGYRDAVAAMGARGGLLSEDLLQIKTPHEELFLRRENHLTAVCQQGHINNANQWQTTFNLCWVPIQFEPTQPGWAGYARLKNNSFKIQAYGPTPTLPARERQLVCTNLKGPTFHFTPAPP